jgi:hypothetical protein
MRLDMQAGAKFDLSIVRCRPINNMRPAPRKWSDYELCRFDDAVKPSLDAG